MTANPGVSEADVSARPISTTSPWHRFRPHTVPMTGSVGPSSYSSTSTVRAGLCERGSREFASLRRRFIKVTLPFDMQYGHGLNAPAASSVPDEVLEHYRVVVRKIHVTVFSSLGSLDGVESRRFVSLGLI